MKVFVLECVAMRDREDTGIMGIYSSHEAAELAAVRYEFEDYDIFEMPVRD